MGENGQLGGANQQQIRITGREGKDSEVIQRKHRHQDTPFPDNTLKAQLHFCNRVAYFWGTQYNHLLCAVIRSLPGRGEFLSRYQVQDIAGW